jgi:hypothetical protein
MQLSKQLAAAALALVTTPAFFAQTAAQSGSPMTLQSATRRGLVEYTFAGTGASSGDSVLLTVRKTTQAAGRALTLTVPEGSMLRSANPGSQSMVVSAVRGLDLGGGRIRPMSQIYLGGDAPVTVVLLAFCAEFEKANPSPGAAFTLEEPNPMLACLASQGRDLSIQAQQAAVWIYTDSITYEHMRRKFQLGPGDWTAAQGLVEHCRSMVH